MLNTYSYAFLPDKMYSNEVPRTSLSHMPGEVERVPESIRTSASTWARATEFPTNNNQERPHRTFDSMQDHVQSHSPIERLPRELYEEIFLLCLPQARFIRPSSRHAPLLLGQICVTWRRIALTTPRLWASLALDEFRGYRLGNILPIILTWVSRAAAVPLAISMGPEVSHPIISVLLTHFSSRCRHIRMPLSSNILWDPEIQEIHVPLLETFEQFDLDEPDTWMVDEPQMKRVTGVLRTAPRLRHIIWSNTDAWGVPHVHWSQLTRLSMTGHRLAAHESVAILQQCINLEHLIFRLMTFASAMVPITLSNLRSLAITAPHDYTELFENLTLPSLCNLSLTADARETSTYTRSSFKSFLERSGCAIDTLNLFFIELSESDLIDTLFHVQHTLRELTIQIDPEDGRGSQTAVTDSILSLLSRMDLDGGRSICLCPRLENLALYACVQCTPGALAKMVLTRLRDPPMTTGGDDNQTPSTSAARLQIVEIFQEDSEFDSLYELRSEGLLLKVYSAVTREPIELDAEDDLKYEQAVGGTDILDFV